MNPNQDPKDILIQRQAQRIGQLITELEWAHIRLQVLQAQLQAAQVHPSESVPETDSSAQN